MTENIRLDISSAIAELVLDNPKRLNALNLSMWEAIPGLIARASADTGVRVVIIHGGTVGHFAAGADISEFAPVYATADGAKRAANALHAATSAIVDCPKPVIAAIEQSCMGAGMSLALAADLRVVADEARFSLPPAKLGAAYPYEDLRRLVDIVGAPTAGDMLLTARVVEADEADRIGLASRRVKKGAALDTAQSIAEEMIKLSPWAQAAGKAMLREICRGQRSETPAMRALQVEGFLGPEFFEGQKAFFEKRAPKF